MIIIVSLKYNTKSYIKTNDIPNDSGESGLFGHGFGFGRILISKQVSDPDSAESEISYSVNHFKLF